MQTARKDLPYEDSPRDSSIKFWISTRLAKEFSVRRSSWIVTSKASSRSSNRSIEAIESSPASPRDCSGPRESSCLRNLRCGRTTASSFSSEAVLCMVKLILSETCVPALQAVGGNDFRTAMQNLCGSRTTEKIRNARGRSVGPDIRNRDEIAYFRCGQLDPATDAVQRGAQWTDNID